MTTRDIYVVDGYVFDTIIYHDSDADPPWDSCSDGEGLMRLARNARNKRPGERPIRSHFGDTWLFDWQAAAKRARKEGWDAEPLDAPNRVQRAVQNLFDYYKGFLNADWSYVVVGVSFIGMDDFNYLGCVESECVSDAIQDIARDLIGGLA